jgi:Holliday junction resolvase-like predicted endonuclease
MSLDSKIEHCRNAYEDYHDKLIRSGDSNVKAAEYCAHNFLDGKPEIKGLSPLNRSIAFWNCGFWQDAPAAWYTVDAVALALGRAIHFGFSDFDVLDRLVQIAPETVKRAIRYSQLFLQPESPLWFKFKNPPNPSEDFRDFLRACDRIREILQTHDETIENLQSQLADLTVFEFLLYGSLFAYQNIVPERFNKTENSILLFEFEQEASDALNQLLVWKLKTRPENDFKLNERFLAKSLKRHLMPLFFPTEGSLALCKNNLKLFTSLTEAMLDRNNFRNQTITSFSFDDDYRYKFDGDHLTIYPVEIPEESDWDRNGRKLKALNTYWINRALIEYSLSDLDDTPFGTPENDDWNREAYIKATQVFLQLVEIFGMESEIELPNGTRVDLFSALQSLELMTAFFKVSYIDHFKTYYELSGNWIGALGQLMMEGLAEGENRFPLTWAEPAIKAQRIKSWTVSDSHPEGDIKAAEAILSFWSNDLFSLANSLKKQPNIPVPEFHERPILQLGDFGFQLPWLMAAQNNSTAAINNFRRLGSRRSGRKKETHRIEQRFGDLLEEKGFNVLKSYQPKISQSGDAGEIDLICFLEGHLFILEIKSTYIKKTQQDAWIHYTNTLRKAARQLTRKQAAVLSALEHDQDFRSRFEISDQDTSTKIHSWIVDTSVEYDQSIIDGFLKVSLEGLIVILRNERALLKGLLHENNDFSIDDLFPDGFSARRFAEIVEQGLLWSVLNE